MKGYGPEIREAALRRILPPNPESISSVSRDMGISIPTLMNWKNRASADDNINMEQADEDSCTLSSDEKFEIVVAAAAMNETQLGEFAREKGLYVEQINNWCSICRQANANFGEVHAQFKAREKEKDAKIVALKAELDKKDKIIAELAAEIVLRKKSWAIWGEKKEE